MEKMALIFSNFASSETAKSTARILMQEKVITCANIFQSHFSIYPWDGKIVEQNETAVFFKAPIQNKEKLIARLHDLHPYDLPGIISLDAEAMPKYVEWLNGDHQGPQIK